MQNSHINIAVGTCMAELSIYSLCKQTINLAYTNIVFELMESKQMGFVIDFALYYFFFAGGRKSKLGNKFHGPMSPSNGK